MSQTCEEQHNLDRDGYPLPRGRQGRLRKQAIRTGKAILGKSIYLLMSLVGGLIWLGRLASKLPAVAPLSAHPHIILVIRLDLIGDLVLWMTAVRALKRTYPEAEMDLLALPASSKVVYNDPDLARIITYDPNVWRRPKALLQPKNWREAYTLLRRLRAGHYDIALSIYGNWAGLLAVLSGAQRRVGFGRESYPGFMTDNVPGRHWSLNDHKHEVDYCLELAQAAGAAITPADPVPRLYVYPQARQQLKQLLLQEGVQPAKPLIACHVTSHNGHSKPWPIPYWAALLDILISDLDAQVVLTGASNDFPLIKLLTSRFPDNPFTLPP